jgi:hypothetical protein
MHPSAATREARPQRFIRLRAFDPDPDGYKYKHGDDVVSSLAQSYIMQTWMLGSALAADEQQPSSTLSVDAANWALSAIAGTHECCSPA